jgi:serine/threonine protein kinase
LPVLEHYEILQPLGRGGMGEVFLARDKRLKRKVALKFLVPAFAADHERRRRFEQEALLASALNHPNILTVYEIGAVNDTYFIATEFVEGETLRQRLRQAPLAETDAVNIALQIAAALQAAHQAGIIHRDIKPENIMVRPDGIVKVLDFGIAKSTEPKAVGTETLPMGTHTATGQIIGTPAYIAPEQLRGLKPDGRSDLFSLGVVSQRIG